MRGLEVSMVKNSQDFYTYSTRLAESAECPDKSSQLAKCFFKNIVFVERISPKLHHRSPKLIIWLDREKSRLQSGPHPARCSV